MQPIYTTKADHLTQRKPKRRRIGEMGKELKRELSNLSLFERKKAEIAVSILLLNVLNH